jgi:hypothetical protein
MNNNISGQFPVIGSTPIESLRPSQKTKAQEIITSINANCISELKKPMNSSELEQAKNELAVKTSISTITLGAPYFLRQLKSETNSPAQKAKAFLGLAFSGLASLALSIGTLGLFPLVFGLISKEIAKSYISDEKISKQAAKNKAETVMQDAKEILQGKPLYNIGETYIDVQTTYEGGIYKDNQLDPSITSLEVRDLSMETDKFMNELGNYLYRNNLAKFNDSSLMKQLMKDQEFLSQELENIRNKPYSI